MKIVSTILLLALTILVQAQVPTNGLVAWYPFNGNANDESGNGNNGTPVGASLTTDRYNSANHAFFFDGYTNYIEIPDAPSLDIANAITISGWVYKLWDIPYSTIVTKGGVNSDSNNYALHFLDTVGLGFTTNISANYNSTPISLWAWHHVSVTWDGTIVVFYVDGQPDISAVSNLSGILPTNTSPMTIGADFTFGDEFFYGMLDDIRIYNRALSPSEVSQVYTESPCNVLGASVSGKLKYDGDINKNLSSCTVYLKTQAGNTIDNTLTDFFGHYYFCNVGPGDYKITVSPNLPAGGVNSVDALQVLKHYTGMLSLTGLHLKAGDVNGNNYLNSTDALLIAKYYIGNISAFPVGNWVFEEINFSISGTNALTYNINGICSGDANGSYFPSDYTSQACPGLETFEYNGQVYNTVQVGSQCWMRENLNIGTLVSSITTVGNHSNQGNNGVIEKYCYDNNPDNCLVYGGLYEWNEMMQYTTIPGIQGICPSGWHLPDLTELQTLQNFLGGVSVAGGKLKETGTLHWAEPNSSANNSSGFTALGAGYRAFTGSFNFQQSVSNFWSSSQAGNTLAKYLVLSANQASAPITYDYRNFGFSVRCVKN
jgi:uncharacterized protein (TIGR02145 family)